MYVRINRHVPPTITTIASSITKARHLLIISLIVYLKPTSLTPF